MQVPRRAVQVDFIQQWQACNASSRSTKSTSLFVNYQVPFHQMQLCLTFARWAVVPIIPE
jgi:hypothetical protein